MYMHTRPGEILHSATMGKGNKARISTSYEYASIQPYTLGKERSMNLGAKKIQRAPGMGC